MKTFDRLFDRSFARCECLTEAQARQFVEHGYVIVKQAFSAALAQEVVAQAWRDLGQRFGVEEGRPKTWNQHLSGPIGVHGYARTQPSERRFNLSVEAPLALQAQADLVGGRGRIASGGDRLAWSDAAIANLPAAPTLQWRVPAARAPGWHKDGWHFRHFLNSPEQGLLVVPIFTNILARSGGTLVAPDSLAPTARLLRSQAQGLHADSVQGRGYLIPYLIEQCRHFDELTGAVGDLALLHPFLLHRVAPNPSPRPRFIANYALVLKEPMQFQREDQTYSLVELAVLRAFGGQEFRFRATRPPLKYVPEPFRDAETAEKEAAALAGEMRALARRGLVSPVWANEYDYLSNATGSDRVSADSASS